MRPHPGRSRTTSRHKVVWAALCIAALVLLAPWGGAQFAVLDLATLGCKPAAVLLIASAGWLIVKSENRAFRGALLVALIPVGLILVPMASTGVRNCEPGAPTLRIAWINAMRPESATPIASWLVRETPQIVGFAELGTSSSELRKVLVKRYPHWASCLPNGRCSTLIYTTQPTVSVLPLAKRDPENRKSLSAVQMRFGTDDMQGHYDIIAAHLSRPLPLGRQADELAQVEQAITDPANTILMGDFNMPPSMRILDNFAARNGFTIIHTDRPTWPMRFGQWKTPGLWQIDALLVGHNWTVKAIRLSPDLGSDHRGYTADLCWIG